MLSVLVDDPLLRSHAVRYERMVRKLEYSRPKSDPPPTGSGANGPCAVCLEEITLDAGTRSCRSNGHAFHHACLTTWLDTGHGTCPVCRGAVALSATERENRRRADHWWHCELARTSECVQRGFDLVLRRLWDAYVVLCNWPRPKWWRWQQTPTRATVARALVADVAALRLYLESNREALASLCALGDATLGTDRRETFLSNACKPAVCSCEGGGGLTVVEHALKLLAAGRRCVAPLDLVRMQPTLRTDRHHVPQNSEVGDFTRYQWLEHLACAAATTKIDGARLLRRRRRPHRDRWRRAAALLTRTAPERSAVVVLVSERQQRRRELRRCLSLGV